MNDKAVFIMKLFLLILCISLVFPLPNKKTAHIRNSIGSRIIGGKVAFTGQFPFATAITKRTPNGYFFCGGTLLTEQWILSSGQCIDGATLFTIQLGSSNLNGSDSSLVEVSTDTYILHPEYDPLTLHGDIGAIRIRQPLQFSYYLLPVHVLIYNEMSPGSIVRALGWGQIADDEPGIVDELRYVEVITLSDAECRSFYGDQITDSMMCVIGNYNEGTCIGDSGSPLVQDMGKSYSLFVGISSFVSQNGCESTDPSGFTTVYRYLSWIQETTGRTG